MLKSFTIFFMWLLLLGIFVASRAQNLSSSPFCQPTSRTYTPADGLPSSDVTCLFQDKAGYLWVGTKGGLARWEGSSFKSWTSKDGFLGGVGSIHQLPDGRIICVAFRGIYILAGEHLSPLYSDPRFRFYLREGFLKGEKLYLLVDNAQRYETGAHIDYLVCFDTRRLGFQLTDSVKAPLSGVVGLSSGRTLIFTNDAPGKGRYLIVANGRIVSEIPLPFGITSVSERSSALRGGIVSDNGTIYVARERGNSISLNPVVTVGTAQVSHPYLASDGSVYYVQDGHKLCRYALGQSKPLMAVNSCWAMLEDREGNLWLASEDGLINLFSRSFFRFRFGFIPGSADFISGIAQMPDSSYWVTSRTSGLFHLDKRLSKYSRASFEIDGIPAHGECLYYHPTLRHDTLFYPGDGGLLFVNGANQRFISAHLHSGLFAYTDPATGQVLSGGSDLRRYSGGSLKVLYTGEQLHLNKMYILSLCRDQRGRLWYSSAFTTGFIDRDGSVQVSELSKEGTIETVYMDSYTGLWAGGHSGLWYLDGEHWRHIVHPQLTGAVWALHDYNGRYLIISMDDRVALLDLKAFRQSRTNTDIRAYSLQNGYDGINASQNSIWQDAAGYVWIGAKPNLICFHPDTLPVLHTLPVPMITSIWQSEDRARWLACIQGDTIGVPPNANNLRFGFTSLSLSWGDKLLYRYRLFPFSGWTEPGKATEAPYTNLDPGDYQFEAQCSYDGVNWSKSGIRHVHVQKPWYQQWRARISALLLLVIMTGSATWLFRHALQKRHDQQMKLFAQKMRYIYARAAPHAFKNAVNSILAAMYRGDVEKADRLIMDIADLFNNALSGKLVHSLEEEISSIRTYLDCETSSEEDRLRCFVSIDDDLLKLLVPTPSLFEFAQNAVKHGFASRGGNGNIYISATKTGSGVWLSVKDDGIGRAEGKCHAEAQRLAKVKHQQKNKFHTQIKGEPEGGLSALQELLKTFNKHNSVLAAYEENDVWDSTGKIAGSEYKLFIPFNYDYNLT